MPYPRQNFEVYARIVTAGPAGPAEGSQLLQSFTGGPEAETKAKEYYTRAGEHMLASNDTEWFTQYWTAVVFLGPNGQMDSIERPKAEKAEVPTS